MKNLKGSLIQLFVLFSLCTEVSVSFAQDDVCNALPGTWLGTGKINWFMFECNYTASAAIHAGLLPLSAVVSVKKTAGSFLCPKEADQTVSVDCVDGKVAMKDNIVDIAGGLSEDGKNINLKGNIHVLFRSHPFELTAVKTG